MSGRQRTLFQTWGPSLVRGSGDSGCGQPRSPAMAEALPEEDDEVLLVAAYEAERQLDPGDGGFCAAAGALWIYPTNCPVRDYQLDISRSALFCNTLVCLPTGLGKTFIAAVVMYNFYRWFPSGKVVFMAPTKPLVTQQMEACFHVMGIPQSHMAEMTGSTQAVNRKEIWSSRRVLFLTPQVMVNDLTRGAVPATHVKCLVVDEAHKALGNYAYCQVVRELVKYTTHNKVSDRPSFCESDSEGHNIKYQNSGSNSCAQIQADLENNFVDKNSHDDSEPPVLFTDEDESLLLFEDDFKNIEDGPEELNGASLPPFNSISQPLRVSGKTLTSEMPPVSHFLISDELLLDDDSEPEDQIVCGAKSWKCQEGVEDGSKVSAFLGSALTLYRRVCTQSCIVSKVDVKHMI